MGPRFALQCELAFTSDAVLLISQDLVGFGCQLR